MLTLLQFLPSPPDPDLVYQSTYNLAWVIVSVLLAILASYAALKSSARIDESEDSISKLMWAVISAITMGIGIWAMHFIGMLALNLPCHYHYDLVVTLISMIPGIFASGIALGAWHHDGKHLSPLSGSILLGSGIGLMHYTGMAALHLEGGVYYNPTLFVLSIVVAIALSYFALRIKKSIICPQRKGKVLIAIIMGSAVSGMHYTAMSATYFVKDGKKTIESLFGFTPNTLALTVAVTTIFLAMLVLALATLSRNRLITRRLQRSELKFRSLYNSTSDAVMVLNEKGFIDCNKATLEIFGCANIAEFCTCHPADLSPPLQPCGTDSMTLANLRIATAIKKGSLRFEWLHKRFDTGKSFPAEVLLSAMKWDGKPVLQATVRDISERKQTETDLRIAATAFESQEGILVTDMNLIILRVNKAFTDITGYTAEEAIGQMPKLLSSKQHDKSFYTNMWADLTQIGSWKGEIWDRRKNGGIYPQQITITAVKNSDNTVTHYVATFIDITERKLAEESMRRAELEAIRANQAKSEFLANMSHEIRTPMNAILGFSSILSDLITDQVQQHYLNAIHTSGMTLLHLINDILDISKIEAGKLELNYRPISITTVFNDIAVVFAQKLAEQDLHFSLELAENIPDFLFLDEIRLRQILLNLVGNAVKFTDHGFIRVSVTAQPFSTNLSDFNENSNRIALSIAISDTGIGIAENQLESIFSAFTQQKNQSVRYGGTGLGLTICKRIVEMMGGTITVQSQAGQGSCFTVNLPDIVVADAPEPTANENLSLSSATTVHFRPATLLLVDDIELNRHLIKSYLRDYPELKFIEAENGEQALTLAEEHRFDLVFMDWRLSGEDGNNVSKKIKALPGYADIPIIIITASILFTPATQPKLFYDFQLSKPLKKADLLNAMQSFLPMAKATETIIQPLLPILTEKSASTKNLSELLDLLNSHYQTSIAKFYSSGALEIDTLIGVAEQLQQIAAQYHCQSLTDWATTLKQQAELFEINHLPKTLTGFDTLLKQLETEIAEQEETQDFASLS